MNKEWSLDELYLGYDDPKFLKDMEQVKVLADTMRAYASGEMQQEDDETALVHILEYQEQFRRLIGNLFGFVSLKQTVNTTDAETTALMGQLEKIDSSLAKEMSMMKRRMAEVPDLEAVISGNEFLKEYEFLLLSNKKAAAHQLSDEVEEVLAKMNISGGSQYEMQQSYMTATVKVPYEDRITNLSEIRNLAYDADPEVRKKAYAAEIASYDAIKDGVAFSLNGLKQQVNTEAELRGYDSALAMTLDRSRMTKRTLDAMFEAMDEFLPKFHAYLRKKAELLGHKNGLPWYDLFAPMTFDAEGDKTYTTEEAKQYLLDHFRPFAEDLAAMIERAFDQSWIDFYPHNGKVGGAFCAEVCSIRQSRILTNFTGSFSDVVTLAHELGHAYHNEQIFDQRPLNQDYSMPVAETASTFNEVAIMDAAIREAEGGYKLTLIESQLQDTTQIICDILSRYLFEKSVFENRANGFMYPDQLCELMLNAQKQAYGDGLDPECLHPYMWVCKSHYYSSGLSYYNFPYAFGGLFARGLYAQYLEEGEAFLPKYRALLNYTCVSTVEDTAKKAGIDLGDVNFWRRSLQMIADTIDIFIENAK